MVGSGREISGSDAGRRIRSPGCEKVTISLGFRDPWRVIGRNFLGGGLVEDSILAYGPPGTRGRSKGRILIHDVMRHSHRCHATGRPLRPGEKYFSVLVETPVGQERWDYSEEGWSGPPDGTIGFWKGRLPEEQQAPKPREIPVDVMISAFDRWIDDPPTEERTLRLRYVLALLLVRKRALKLHSIRREGSEDILVVRRHSSSETIDIPAVELDESRLAEVEAELFDELESTCSAGEV